MKWLDMKDELQVIIDGVAKLKATPGGPTAKAIRAHRRVVTTNLAKLWAKIDDFAKTLNDDEFDQLFAAATSLFTATQREFHNFIMALPNQGTAN